MCIFVGNNEKMMNMVVKVASYIAYRYQEENGVRIDEMKLHKLLYFTQREAIIRTGKPMFSEQFLAWRYGPVMLPIRVLYAQDALNDMPSDDFIEKNRPIFDFVFANYAGKSSWSLSLLTHGEVSWKNARKDLLPEQNGNTLIEIDDIKKDAERIKIRRFVIDQMRKDGIV